MTDFKPTRPQPLVSSSNKWTTKVVLFVQLVLQKIKNGNLSLSSKAIVYYGILSFFPLISLIGSVIPWLHLDVKAVLGYLETIIPTQLQPLIQPLIVKLLTRSNGGLLSFGILGTLWSSSGVVNILKQSVNDVYGLNKQTLYVKTSWVNALITRFTAIILTAAFILLTISGMVIFIAGQQILLWLQPYVSWGPEIIQEFIRWKWPVSLTMLFLLMSLAYLFLSSSHSPLRYVWPGALLSTMVFLILAQVFSLYLKYFGYRWNSYGTLGTFFILIIWLNLVGNVFMIGAALNAAVLEAWTGSIQHSARFHRFLNKRSQSGS